jgi:exopolysaccharide biosynthesis polyprenyl glycosylphosphotransferase
MLLDAATVFGAAILATWYEFKLSPIAEVRSFWHGTLIRGRSMDILLALMCGFIISLIITSRRLHLYSPARLGGYLHEQRLTVQACFTAGLLLTGTLYLVHADDIPRRIVVITWGLVLISLSIRRLVYRILLYRRFERGLGTRNVLIVGTGPEAHALRHHVESIRHLGYRFKGFIDFPSTGSRFAATSGDVVGTLDNLFTQARKQFVDEIFFTAPCERGIVQEVLEKARAAGVDLRVVPDMYDGLAWNSPIEYIGQFPTIPLHCGKVPEMALVLKRSVDILFSSLVLLLLSPVLLAIAVCIKLDSRGPVFYSSERIGKKGRVFKCRKFRTMVRDADTKRADIMHMNERDGVLFKISNDPRITKLGRFLRKYSLDELPQFFNVLRGEMSLVGPRPERPEFVKTLSEQIPYYRQRHCVKPGITGWAQINHKYGDTLEDTITKLEYDLYYIKNLSPSLDAYIIFHTLKTIVLSRGAQ